MSRPQGNILDQRMFALKNNKGKKAGSGTVSNVSREAFKKKGMERENRNTQAEDQLSQDVDWEVAKSKNTKARKLSQEEVAEMMKQQEPEVKKEVKKEEGECKASLDKRDGRKKGKGKAHGEGESLKGKGKGKGKSPGADGEDESPKGKGKGSDEDETLKGERKGQEEKL